MKNNKYDTFDIAMNAAINIGFSNSADYKKRCGVDKRLPKSPEKFYSDWGDKGGWPVYLGKNLVDEYETWEQASEAAQALGIKNSNDYWRKYKQDPRLPRIPKRSFKSCWVKNKCWSGFLGLMYVEKYENYSDAKKAVQRLNIKSLEEYRVRYREDPKLPSSPWVVFSTDWVENDRWVGFLGKSVQTHYSSWNEASAASTDLGISNSDAYRTRHKEDHKLPQKPWVVYPEDWRANDGWRGYLAKTKPYGSVHLASRAAKSLQVRSVYEYRKRFKEDIKLVKYPERTYCDSIDRIGGIYGFLGIVEPPPTKSTKYKTWKESSDAAKKLSIKTSSEYRKRYKEDPKLPNHPPEIYPKDWQINDGWNGFLGVDNSKYSTWKQASIATKKLKIRSGVEYRKRYKLDPKLPAVPREFYAVDWMINGGWKGFTAGKVLKLYKTWGEASAAAQSLGIKGRTEYLERYKEDQRLPFDPSREYANCWIEYQEWDGFLNKMPDIYPTWCEAAKAAQKIGIYSRADYIKFYKSDPKLRSAPNQIYTNEWVESKSWLLLLPREINSISSLKGAIKYLGCVSQKDYATSYKEYPYAKLPRNPERCKALKDEVWPGWKAVLGIDFYSYAELQKKVQDLGLMNQNQYKRFRIDSGDEKVPAAPDEIYQEWRSWYEFLGKPEPYQAKYITPKYIEWKRHLEIFLKQARAHKVKETSICRFLRSFIIKHDYPTCPLRFLFKFGSSTTGSDLTHSLGDSYHIFINSFIGYSNTDNAYKVNLSIVEFFDFLIENYLVDEMDDGTPIPLVRNPFHYLSKHLNLKSPNVNVSETNKNILPYHNVKEAREWICPVESNSFKDLKHLYHGFTCDWHQVDEELIDPTDPDCVWEVREHYKHSKAYYIWSPISWILTYALLSTPFRGIQIAYNDSGEADEYIPLIGEKGNIYWERNNGPLSGMLKDQGFIMRCSGDQIGAYCTTNKTHNKGAGYSIPWMEEELARWLIRLREWQKKYNPISKPTSWTRIKRSNLNESQLKNKGANCFLFREFQNSIPGNHTGQLASRLAASLFNIQDKDENLASAKAGKENTISQYSSQFTPHCIRASLITAFIMDFGLPSPVVMKIVGHASIVQTLYYNKPGLERLRDAITLGDKKALKRKCIDQIRMIREGRISEVKDKLIGNSNSVLKVALDSQPKASYTFSDQGICPFAGARCHEGGAEHMNNKRIFQHVPEGYAGQQNCIRCRFFVTGPAFLGGLLSRSNEIFLAARSQSLQVEKLRESYDEIRSLIQDAERNEYDSHTNSANIESDIGLDELTLNKAKLASELERATKKLDMYLCDSNSLNKLIIQCIALVNDEAVENNNIEHPVQLIKREDFEVASMPVESTYFHQLNEVCSNAQIFESASADNAISPRSQILDKMCKKNGIEPTMFMLTQEQQLVVGSQMAELLKSRLKSWTRVDSLLNGDILLSDLRDDEKIYPAELDSSKLITQALNHGHTGRITSSVEGKAKKTGLKR